MFDGSIYKESSLLTTLIKCRLYSHILLYILVNKIAINTYKSFKRTNMPERAVCSFCDISIY